MTEGQILVGKCHGYNIYASVNPVTKVLHSFTIAGTNHIFSNYLEVEKNILSKSRSAK